MDNNKVPFMVIIKKGPKKFWATIFVKAFYDLRNPYPEFDPISYNPEVYGKKTLLANDTEREELIEDVVEFVIENAEKTFGQDLVGTKIEIRPTYHCLISNEALVQECLDIAIDSDPELSSNPEMLHELKNEIYQSIRYHKHINRYYFPGLSHHQIKQWPNKLVKSMIEDKIDSLSDTEITVVYHAKIIIQETFKAYSQNPYQEESNFREKEEIPC